MKNPTIEEFNFLFKKLQQIWDDVGESREEQKKLLLEIEGDLIEVYKRRVGLAVKSRYQLLQVLADAKVLLSRLQCALGENTVPEKTSGTSKEQLAAITPALERLHRQKHDRLKEFSYVQSQIAKICGESTGKLNHQTPVVDENDLSLKKLEEYQFQLQELQKEKLQKLALQLTELWNLMNTPDEERSPFEHVTRYISATVDEVTIPGALALDLIEQAEVEVKRLALKKQVELAEIYACARIQFESEAAREKILALIDSENVDLSKLIADMDSQIVEAKKQAFSRKEILDGVKKWMLAREEESWLENYNPDQNRDSASESTHINLKRAEQARILVNKIPAMVDTLVAKTHVWEEDHGTPFTYDGVPLLTMMEEYVTLRKRRLRGSSLQGFQRTCGLHFHIRRLWARSRSGLVSINKSKLIVALAVGGFATSYFYHKLLLLPSPELKLNKFFKGLV